MDFPAPLGPRNPKISPRATLKSMPRTAGSVDFGYVKVSPRTRITSVATLDGVAGLGGLHGAPDLLWICGYLVPTRLPGAPRATIVNFQKLLKSLKGRRGWPRPAINRPAAEELALVLSSHGLQRMTARVLAALLFTEQPTMTMGELADRLLASPGAISGALKMLTSVGIVERVPAPGQPTRPLPAARQRLGGSVHQSERSDRSRDQGRRGRDCDHRGRTAWLGNASFRCATSTPSCSRRFRRCWTAGTSASRPRRRSSPLLVLLGYLEVS